MSKAFTKDDAASDEPLLPPRAPLPDGMPNYVTARGLRLLQEEAAALDRERRDLDARDPAERRRAAGVLAARSAALAARLASAVLVEPDPGAQAVRFGSRVRVRLEDGTERTHRIVGVDEADPARGDIAFTSPIARALLGKAPGDEAIVRAPGGDQALEVVAIEPVSDPASP